MASRFGNVVFWTCAAIAALLAVMTGNEGRQGASSDMVLLFYMIAVLIALFGLAVRYVLAGGKGDGTR